MNFIRLKNVCADKNDIRNPLNNADEVTLNN